MGLRLNTVESSDCTNEELVNMMVGRSVEQVYARTENEHEGITLKTENLCDYKGRCQKCKLYVERRDCGPGRIGWGQAALRRPSCFMESRRLSLEKFTYGGARYFQSRLCRLSELE